MVLVGGRSSRMGRSKAGLDWHGTSLQYRTAAVLDRAGCRPIVVVTAPDQPAGELPGGASTVADPVADRGPLQGIAAGLAAVVDRAPTAFVCATDLPLLHPAFVGLVLARLDQAPDAEIAMPMLHGRHQPLAAAYRTALADRFAALLDAGVRRLGELGRYCAVAALDAADLLADPALARLDPELDSVRNVNTPADLAVALTRPAPEVSVDLAGRALRIRAATITAAAAAVRADPRGALLNGAAADPRSPLVTGDRLVFR